MGFIVIHSLISTIFVLHKSSIPFFILFSAPMWIDKLLFSNFPINLDKLTNYFKFYLHSRTLNFGNPKECFSRFYILNIFFFVNLLFHHNIPKKRNQLPNNTTCNTSRGCVFSQKTLSLPGVPIVCTHAPPYAEQ